MEVRILSPAPERIVVGKIAAVGDIHGEFEKLHDIVGQLEDTIDFEKDTVVFVGDYVDGG